MSKIYYKNSQTNDFIQLTYKDIGAASVTHTHTIKDIKAEKYGSNPVEYISQVLAMSNGGADISNTLSKNATAGVYAAKINTSQISAIPIDNGVLGYYNQSNNYPSFQTWPVTAGGTGCTNQLDVIQKFNIGITNGDEDFIFDLNGYYILDAGITNSAKQIHASIYLPFQLLSGTTGTIEMYPWIVQQSSATRTNNYPQSKYLCGFKAPFTVDKWTTTENCIYYWGYDGNDAGPVNLNEAVGKVITYPTSGGPVFNDNQEIIYYQTGHIFTIVIDFLTTAIIPADSNYAFVNNRPIWLFPNKGLSKVKNQIIIPKFIPTENTNEEPTDEEEEEEE